MKSARAFTLLEVLIAASLFACVLFSVYSAFRAGLLSYRKTDTVSTFFRKGRILFNRLEADLKNSYVYSQDNAGFKGTASSLEFFSVVDFFAGGKKHPHICRIKYTLQDKGLERAVLRGANALKTEEEALPIKVLFPVQAVSFQYAGISNGESAILWSDTWGEDSNQKNVLPLAIKIKLRIIENNKNSSVNQAAELERVIPLN